MESDFGKEEEQKDPDYEFRIITCIIISATSLAGLGLGFRVKLEREFSSFSEPN